MENNVISDAVRLASRILEFWLPNKPWDIVNIAKHDEETFSLKEYVSIPTSFGYKYDKTPILLEQNGVIEEKTVGWWYIDIVSINSYWGKVLRPDLALIDYVDKFIHEKRYVDKNKIVEYYYHESSDTIGPRMHGQAAVLVKRKALEQFKKKFGNITENKNEKNSNYENGELRLTRQDGSPCTLDFSKAPEYRPVFESFYYLYRDGSKKLFSREELLDKYKELTKKNTEWREFIQRKSSIVGKMINLKPCLKSRIVWEYDKGTDKYKFEILPLSDK